TPASGRRLPGATCAVGLWSARTGRKTVRASANLLLRRLLEHTAQSARRFAWCGRGDLTTMGEEWPGPRNARIGAIENSARRSSDENDVARGGPGCSGAGSAGG